MLMNSKLEQLINSLSLQEKDISSERKMELDNIASIIKSHLEDSESLEIIVVCTHNSRRSQLGETWINTLADHFGIKNIVAYSGGMEVTAFNERMVNAIRDFGFDIIMKEDGANPKYVINDIKMNDHLMYSKVYDDASNPQSNFMALMVCDHADENCPIVHGMKYRIPLRYKDPKEFDDTDQEKEAYTNKVNEIGGEMYYLLNQVNPSL